MQKILSKRSKSDQAEKAERVWTDKGSEFKGEIKKFFENKEIHLYTTENETKSVGIC